jgi:hypothetical protein
MGTITITAAGFNPGPNGTRTTTISDADWQNLITYQQNAQKPNATEANPNPTVPTPVQALLGWVNNWLNQTRDEIASAQRRQAQQQAADAVVVTPIVFG